MDRDEIYSLVDKFVDNFLNAKKIKIKKPKIIVSPPGPKSRRIIKTDEKINSKGSFSRLLPISVKDGYKEFVIDVDGNIYRDHFSGATAANLGYGLNEFTKPIISELIKQSISIQHIPYMYVSNPFATKLAEKLLEIAPKGFDKVSFSVSGSVSNDYAIKMVRRYTKRKGLLTFENAFHGNSFGAASVSGFNLLSKEIGNIGKIFTVPFPTNDETAKSSIKKIERIISHEKIGGIFIESIQADSGILIPPNWYFKELKEICNENNVLIIDDEVQTGLGRTGKWFGIEHFDIIPDIITIGKGLSGGFIPMAATITRREIADATEKPQLITTFLGHPIGSVVALEVIQIIEKLLPSIKVNGKFIDKLQKRLARKYNVIKDVRGIGYLRGIEMQPQYGPLTIFRSLEKGEIFGLFGIKNEVIRDAPPFIMSKKSLLQGYKKLEEVFTEIENNTIPKSTKNKVRRHFKGMSWIL